MAQEKEWEREYRNSKLLTKENKPQADVVRFVRWLRENGIEVLNSKVLDLGSGTGRNSFYFAELGAKVIGVEISKTAIDTAEENLKSISFDISYVKGSIGEKLHFENESFDILLDVTSSNSLSEKEREVYLSETNQVLRPGGIFFTKALCKDGDINAKELLKKFPGKEKDTYVLPDIKVEEKVWSKEDFIQIYEKYFKILYMEKKSSYTRMNNRVYKRNFWICYMKK